MIAEALYRLSEVLMCHMRLRYAKNDKEREFAVFLRAAAELKAKQVLRLLDTDQLASIHQRIEAFRGFDAPQNAILVLVGEEMKAR